MKWMLAVIPLLFTIGISNIYNNISNNNLDSQEVSIVESNLEKVDNCNIDSDIGDDIGDDISEGIGEDTGEDEDNTWIYTNVDTSKITNTVDDMLEYHGSFSEEQIEVLKEIESKLAKYPYKISLIGYKLDGEQSFCYNSDMTHHSACTIKAAYAYSLCRYMEENNINLDTELVYLQKHKFDGAGKIKYASFGTKYTLREVINYSLSISDNVAYKMLLDKFGTSYHNNLMDELGCNSLKISGMWASKCTAKDFVVIWSAIYDYFTHSDSEYSKLFKESCTNTIWNHSCVTLKGYDYSHKSGDNYPPWDAQNDACIVWKDEPYILAMFIKASFTYINEPQRDSITDLVHQKLW